MTFSEKRAAKNRKRKARKAKWTKKQRETYLLAYGKVLNKGIDNWKLFIAKGEVDDFVWKEPE